MTAETPVLQHQTEGWGSSASHAKRTVALLVLTASIGYLCRTAITVVAPGIMFDFHLSQTQMGTVFSAFLVGYTAFQVPSGWIADRVNARTLLTAVGAAWALLTAANALVGWHGFAGTLAALMAIRALFGIAAAPTYPASARTIAVIVPERLQGSANGAVLASIGIGSAVTPLLLGAIVVRSGWRMALAASALMAAVVTVLWAISHKPAAGSTRAATPGDWRKLNQRSYWYLFASYFLQGYVGYIFVFWFYLYLVQVRHFEVLQASVLAAMPWLFTLIAIPGGGALSDALVTRWGAAWGRRALPAVALVVGALFLVIGARTASATVAVACLTACTVLVLCTEGPFWATMTQLCGEHSGTGGGVMNFGSNLGGMISPALTPWLAERIGWGAALSFTAVLAAIAGLLWLGVRVEQSAPSFASGVANQKSKIENQK